MMPHIPEAVTIHQKGKDYTGTFDDERIADGVVSQEEKDDLERTLFRMYFEKAHREGKEVVPITERSKYEKMREHALVPQGTNSSYFLFVSTKGIDFRTIAYHLLDTDEGLFYGKLLES